jgi:UDPglucose 6-dehydrogenase
MVRTRPAAAYFVFAPDPARRAGWVRRLSPWAQVQTFGDIDAAELELASVTTPWLSFIVDVEREGPLVDELLERMHARAPEVPGMLMLPSAPHARASKAASAAGFRVLTRDLAASEIRYFIGYGLALHACGDIERAARVEDMGRANGLSVRQMELAATDDALRPTNGHSIAPPHTLSPESMAKRLTVMGTGYVGLVLGACLADSGHRVTCVDIDERRIASLRRGRMPIHERGLDEVIARATSAGSLSFTCDAVSAVRQANVIFIAVGTPEDRDGAADLRYVLDVAKTIGNAMNGPKVIVCKSTVPVGTCSRIRDTLERLTDHDFHVVSNPEFLREGSAIEDFRHPDRVIIGADDERAGDVVASIYEAIVPAERVVRMATASAEMSKYAANSLLATRISFMNEIANICERVGADVEEVREGIGLDHRIGPHFLRSGVGYGGSCFPKDVRALASLCHEHGLEPHILRATDQANEEQKLRLVQIASDLFATLRSRRFAIWGLSFKAGTDDVREAPAIDSIRALVARGAEVCVTDPVAIPNARRALSDLEGRVRFVDDPYVAVEGADALLVFTEWEDFLRADLRRVRRRMRSAILLDGRNLFGSDAVARSEFLYLGIGRRFPSERVDRRPIDRMSGGGLQIQ